jgi:hypothetical protein
VPTEAEKASELAGRDRSLSVACPECKRMAGDRCITLSHQPTNLVHKRRVAAWKAAGSPIQEAMF